MPTFCPLCRSTYAVRPRLCGYCFVTGSESPAPAPEPEALTELLDGLAGVIRRPDDVLFKILARLEGVRAVDH
jgi:hypothetical protein